MRHLALSIRLQLCRGCSLASSRCGRQAQGLYSSVAERQSCKLKVLGSIPSGACVILPRSRCCWWHVCILDRAFGCVPSFLGSGGPCCHSEHARNARASSHNDGRRWQQPRRRNAVGAPVRRRGKHSSAKRRRTNHTNQEHAVSPSHCVRFAPPECICASGSGRGLPEKAPESYELFGCLPPLVGILAVRLCGPARSRAAFRPSAPTLSAKSLGGRTCGARTSRG